MTHHDSDKLEAARAQIAELKRRVETAEQSLTSLGAGPDPIFSLTPDGRYAHANEALADVFGTSVEDIVGKGIRDFFPKEEADRRLAVLSEVFRTGENATIEGRVPRDGEDRYYQTTIWPVRDAAGQVVSAICTSRDISAHRQVEVELRESEARLTRAHRVAGLGNWEWNLLTNQLYWSPQNYGLHGIDPQRVKPSYQAFLDVVDPAEHEFINRSVADAVAGTTDYEIDYTVIRPDTGEHRVIHSKADVLRDDAGKALRMVGTVQDVTERKRVEESLVQLQQAVEASGEVIFMTDREGLITFVNPAFTCLYGFSATEVVGRATPRVLKSGVLSAEDYEAFWRAILGKHEVRGELVNKTKDGRLLTVESASNAVLDDEGKIVSFVTIQRDATERRRVDQALRESEGRFRSLVEQAGDGFELLNAEGRYLDTNGASCRQLGYSREELLQLSILDIDPLLTREKFAASFQALVDARPVTFESQHRRKDGTIFPVEVTTSVMRLGDVLVALALARDTTDRKRAEQERARLEGQLHQAQKMESVGRLAGGVAHDFNNMLGVILGHAELALEDVDPAQPLYDDLVEIKKAAQRSADLTRQLLAFARRQTVTPKVLDLNEAVESILTMLVRLIGEDIHLAWSPGKDVWPLKVDPSQIDQILTNVCVNARDAMSNGGTLTIETARVTFDADYCAANVGVVPGDYVQLAVTDDGCGMDTETQSHLFEPFFTTKETGKGTGLGLATVYGIVEQNHGFIKVQSEPGHGTAFNIYLPRHQGTALPERTNGVAEPTVRSHETILLVEDEVALLRTTQRMLEGMGYIVLIANTPGDALRLAQQHPSEIHLLMTDVIMPEMNGRDLAKNLLTRHPRLERLFMSGYTSDVIASHGVLDEGVNFIQKPFSKETLFAKVRGALDRRPGRRSERVR